MNIMNTDINERMPRHLCDASLPALRDDGRGIAHQTGRLKKGPIHGIYHDSVPHNDEEKTKHDKQSLSPRKEIINIPCLKGQFENLSSRSEYLSSHLSNVPINLACETSVRDIVAAALFENVLKEA